jgi:hypothetical protein
MNKPIVGNNARLFCAIDEISYSDWEDRKSYRGIILVELAGDQFT